MVKIKSTQENNKTSSFVSEMLQVLYEIADWSVASSWYRGKSQEEILRIRRAMTRKQFAETIRHLKNKKLIKIKETAEGSVIALTEGGRMRALREYINFHKSTLPKGETCMVIFDIPEQARTVRKTFRMFLKESGFKMVQGSVWESPFDVFDVLAEFVHRAGLQDWVDIIHAQRRMHGVRKGPAGPNRPLLKSRKFQSL